MPKEMSDTDSLVSIRLKQSSYRKTAQRTTPTLALCYKLSCPDVLYSILAIYFQHPKLPQPFVYLTIIFSMLLPCLLSFPQHQKLCLTIWLLNKYQLSEWANLLINTWPMHLHYISLTRESINSIRNNIDTQEMEGPRVSTWPNWRPPLFLRTVKYLGLGASL